MSQFLDRLERVRGVPVLAGAALVILNFVVRVVAYLLVSDTQQGSVLLFVFTDGNLLLHLGVLVGLVGVLIGDIL